MLSTSNEAILKKKLSIAHDDWNTLQSQGVTEATSLRIDLHWIASTETQAQSLASAFGSQTGITPFIGLIQKKWSIEATYGPQSFSFTSFQAFVKQMCELGFTYECQFDGWVVNVPDKVLKSKPWWQFW